MSHQDLAERFGRKVIDGLIANQPVEYIEYFARLAGSYGRLYLESREQHRADVLNWYAR